MKPKHISLMVILVVITIVGSSVAFEIHRHRIIDIQPGLASLKRLSEIKVPDKAVLAQMDRLQRSMHLLSTAPAHHKRLADLSSLGYVPLSAKPSVYLDDSPARAANASYRVSMAFDGQVKRFCVVDGHLYAEKAVLPDGATIEKIESRRVLIAKEKIKQWLMVEPVFDTSLLHKRLKGDSG